MPNVWQRDIALCTVAESDALVMLMVLMADRLSSSKVRHGVERQVAADGCRYYDRSAWYVLAY